MFIEEGETEAQRGDGRSGATLTVPGGAGVSHKYHDSWGRGQGTITQCFLSL